jgi:hypothetical protein
MRVLVGTGLAVSVAAILRLGVLVAATPTSLWLDAHPRLVDFSEPPNALSEAVAETVSRLVEDPALIRSRLSDCRSDNGATGDSAGERALRSQRCLDLIDQALQTIPSSGELWLFRADRLLRAGQTDLAIVSLRNSYATTAREGWIASGRVVVGLQIYPLLPADMQESVEADLRLVLHYPQFAELVAEAYKKNGALRRASASALQRLPSDLLDRFVATVRSAA